MSPLPPIGFKMTPPAFRKPAAGRSSNVPQGLPNATILPAKQMSPLRFGMREATLFFSNPPALPGSPTIDKIFARDLEEAHPEGLANLIVTYMPVFKSALPLLNLWSDEGDEHLKGLLQPLQQRRSEDLARLQPGGDGFAQGYDEEDLKKLIAAKIERARTQPDLWGPAKAQLLQDFITHDAANPTYTQWDRHSFRDKARMAMGQLYIR